VFGCTLGSHADGRAKTKEASHAGS
jgi:hypothetical protein